MDYALTFTLSYDILAPTFGARVVIHGRSLLTFEDGEWWNHGVAPGGLTAEGTTEAACFANFRRTLGEILDDIGHDISNSGGGLTLYQQAVQAFVDDVCRPESARWEQARNDIGHGAGPQPAMVSVPMQKNLRDPLATVEPLAFGRHYESVSIAI